MIIRLKKFALTASAAAFAVWLVFFFVMRVKSDAHNNNVLLVYSLNEIKTLCIKENYPVESALKRLASLGLNLIMLKTENFEDWLFSNSVRTELPEGKNIPKNSVLLVVPKDNFRGVHQTLEEILGRDIEYNEKQHSAEIILGRDELKFLGGSMFGLNLSDYELVKNHGMECVAEIFLDSNAHYGFTPEMLDRLVFFDAGIRYVLVRGRRMMAHPGRSAQFARYLISKGVRLVFLEFYKQDGLRETANAMANFVVPSHDLITGDGNYLRDSRRINARLLRAVKERSVRLVLMHTFQDAGVERNFQYITDLIKTVRRSGLEIQDTLPYFKSSRTFVGLRQLFAFLLAVGIPVAALFMLKSICARGEPHLKTAVLAFFGATAVSLAGGIFVYSILSTFEFVLRVRHFQGVKLAYVIPFAVVCAAVVRKEEWPVLWNYCVKIKHLITLGLVFLLVYIALSRTGNVSSFVMPFEGILRDVLDNVFGVRPRFKEFLFGHPLLVAGLWLWIVEGRLNENMNRLGRFFVCLGFIGQMNIVNTFLHAHTPLAVSTARTLYGAALGGVLGIILIIASKYLFAWRARSLL